MSLTRSEVASSQVIGCINVLSKIFSHFWANHCFFDWTPSGHWLKCEIHCRVKPIRDRVSILWGLHTHSWKGWSVSTRWPMPLCDCDLESVLGLALLSLLTFWTVHVTSSFTTWWVSAVWSLSFSLVLCWGWLMAAESHSRLANYGLGAMYGPLSFLIGTLKMILYEVIK